MRALRREPGARQGDMRARRTGVRAETDRGIQNRIRQRRAVIEQPQVHRLETQAAEIGADDRLFKFGQQGVDLDPFQTRAGPRSAARPPGMQHGDRLPPTRTKGAFLQALLRRCRAVLKRGRLAFATA